MEDKKATEVCEPFYPGDAAKKLLTPDISTEQYLKLLLQNKLYVDAMRVLAYALPKQQAIAWAGGCARQFSEAYPSDKSTAALEAVQRWLADPSEENRRTAVKVAEQAEFNTPAGSAALAVFFSGGSIAPPDMPETEPHQTMMPNSVFNAVMLAALSKEPEKAEEKYKAFLATGQKLAKDQQG
jgi:hypothetical protein